MARNYGRVLCSIWDDADFVQLSPDAQRMYLFLLSQVKLSMVGLLDYMPRRWAKAAVGLTEQRVAAAVSELEQHRFVVVDVATDELVLRTFCRHDGATQTWKQLKGLWSAWGAVQSPRLRDVILRELPDDAWGHEKAPAPIDRPTDSPIDRETDREVTVLSIVPEPVSLSPEPSTVNREPVAVSREVDAGIAELCDYLAERISTHGHVPKLKVTDRWHKDMRLLRDRGPLHVEDSKPVTPQKIRATIDVIFSQLARRSKDGFCWADQIQSPGALREHWLKMAMAVNKDVGGDLAIVDHLQRYLAGERVMS